MEKANREIRAIIKKRRLHNYEIAEKLKVSEYTFCRWMRNELDPEHKAKVEKAVEEVTQELLS